MTPRMTRREALKGVASATLGGMAALSGERGARAQRGSSLKPPDIIFIIFLAC